MDLEAVSKTRSTAMGAAEAKRNLEGNVAQDAPACSRGIREGAPGRGALDSDIATQSSSKTHADGKRERAPAQGVKVSDIPPSPWG